MVNVCFTSQELAGLQYLDHRAQVLYLQVFKPRVDHKTGIVGKTYRISEQALKEHLEVHPEQGCRPTPNPTRSEIRVILKILERTGLIERIPNKPMCWRLPMATGPVACVLSQVERDSLLYLNYRAQVLYLHLKPCMDGTGYAGKQQRINNRDVIDWLSVKRSQGSRKPAFTPNRDHCRASIDELKRKGLIERAPIKTRSLAFALLKIDLNARHGQIRPIKEPTLIGQPQPTRTANEIPLQSPEILGTCVDEPTINSPYEPTDEQPTSFINNNNIKIVPGALCITSDWEPSDEFKQRLKAKKIKYPPDIVLSFAMYWNGPQGKGRFLTQHQWEEKLLEQIILKTGKQKWRFAKSQPSTQKPKPRPQRNGQTVYSAAWKPFDDQPKPKAAKATGAATLAALKAKLGGAGGSHYQPPVKHSQGATVVDRTNPQEAIARCYERVNRVRL